MSGTSASMPRGWHGSVVVPDMTRDEIHRMRLREEAKYGAQIPTHDYTSTACHHGQHGECRKICKYCPAACGCGCHEKEST